MRLGREPRDHTKDSINSKLEFRNGKEKDAK